ncbi:macrophage mannose receptor 1-like [Elgaria multicarinata webbii]|uniref:macrophage mannose receptor 1-like n=1 Tax=Elgaria multicarinata webbii TaxID=159646 RepID=UPI002FCD4EC8
MAAWKGLYTNVDALEHGVEEPRAHAQKSHTGTKENPEEEGFYETADPATSLGGKPTDQVATPWFSAKKPTCTRRVVIIAGATLLATSVSLNVLLLALGIVHNSKMAATLEQVQSENNHLKEAVPKPFLLFNENLQICVAVQEDRSLTGASCDPDALGQHFQWLSRGLLRHAASQLCVAAQEPRSKTRLSLKPCNAQSPLQRWECRWDNLLALEGKNLYFNYGNVAHLVILYSGNGLWSRWVNYKANSSICNTCPPFARDWTFFQGSYYFLSHSPGTWDVANQSCTSLGSHLVTINSANEKTYIATMMKTRSCWIGLIDQVLEGSWTWVDGTYLGPDNNYWHEKEPQGGRAENCALMRNHLWYDYPCRDTYHWICERKP